MTEEHKRKISIALKGRVFSEETKRKMSDAQRGKKATEETRKKLSLAHKGKNNYWFGKHHSEETKRKIREKDSLTIRAKFKTEWGKKIRKNLSMRNTGSGNPMFKHIYSSETLEKMSKNAKKRVFSEETRKKFSENTRGAKNPMYGKPAPRGSGRCKWFNVNGVNCQGTWEKRFVEACFKRGIPIKRFGKRIYLKDSNGDFTYNPDFLINNKQIVEVKGLGDNRWLRKLPFILELKVHVLYESGLIHFEKTGELT